MENKLKIDSDEELLFNDYLHSPIITFDYLDHPIINFPCDNVIVKDGTLEIQSSKGGPLNFEKINKLIFSINGKKYTYKKIE